MYIRYLPVFVLTALLCLPAQADVFDDIRKQDGFVPIEIIKKIEGEFTFSCYNFDPDTQTCEIRHKPTTWRFKPAIEATLRALNRGKIDMRMIVQREEFDGPEGFGCFRSLENPIRSITFDVPWKLRSNKKLAAALENGRSQLLADDTFEPEECFAHFRDGDDFKFKAYDLKGNELPDNGWTSLKFSNRKYDLRRIERPSEGDELAK